MSNINFDLMTSLTGDGYGEFDIACPRCGPTRRTPSNRTRKVCRVWRHRSDFLGYHCCRCGLTGFARRHGAPSDIEPQKLASLQAEAAAREADHAVRQRRKAIWMWQRARAIQMTPAEAYLRSRGISGDLPATLRFLAPYKPKHYPAMIAAFGIAEEPGPGSLRIADDSVVGVHLTLLKSDGSGKADTEPNKITVGPSAGAPIILAPANDLLGLAITEGVEDALSVHETMGLGAWAAGSASRLPALADAIPSYIDCVSIVVDDDSAGREGARGLARLAHEFGFHVEMIETEQMNIDTTQLGIAA